MLCLALPLSLSKFENGVFFFLYLFSLHTLFEFEILNSTEISNANHKKASLLSSSSSSSFTESFSSSQQQQQCHHRFCWNTLLPWTASYLLLFFASSFQVLLFGFEILVELKFCFFFSVMICFMGFFFYFNLFIFLGHWSLFIGMWTEMGGQGGLNLMNLEWRCYPLPCLLLWPWQLTQLPHWLTQHLLGT